MKNFALFLRVHTGMNPSADPKEYEERMAWLQQVEDNGQLVHKGGTMPPIPSAASTVFADGTQKPGAFMEINHFMTGFLIIKAENLEEAQKIAHTNPILKAGGSVEIREIILR